MNLTKLNIFYSWITHPYKLILRSEETMGQKLQIKTNYAYICLFSTILVIISVIFGIWIGYMMDYPNLPTDIQNQRNRSEIGRLSAKTDSLILMIEDRNLALKNLQLVINEGKELFEKPASINIPKPNTDIFADTFTASELLIREEFEKPKRDLALHQNNPKDTMLIVYDLKVPINGLISARFSDSTNHLGIDIVAKPNAPIFAVLAGVIILSEWNPETGYVVCIQHKNGLVSVYKHNASLLVKTGQNVVSGQPIAIIGNSGRLSTGAHLHFELWYNATALDPHKYIKL